MTDTRSRTGRVTEDEHSVLPGFESLTPGTHTLAV